MIITIKVLRVGGAPRSDREWLDPSLAGDRFVARGYLPSGQEVVTSPIVTGLTVAVAQTRAIRLVVEWLFGNRPGWAFEIDDQRLGHTEVVP